MPSTDIGPDWFLVEWMQSKRMTQAELARRTGWSKATANDIYHGVTSYYRQILNEAAAALNIQPWELLMSPADANALRAMREDAIRLAAEKVTAWIPFKPDDDREAAVG
jgi:transcriptional regulator with XRE-family HTH domain